MPASAPGLTTDERAALESSCERENRRAEARQRDSAEGVGVFRPGGARPPTEVMVAFIDQHRDAYGVESICRVRADRPVDVLPAEGRAGAIRRNGRRARCATRC